VLIAIDDVQCRPVSQDVVAFAARRFKGGSALLSPSGPTADAATRADGG